MFKETCMFLNMNNTWSVCTMSLVHFTDDHLVLDNQLVCCSLGNVGHPALKISCL